MPYSFKIVNKLIEEFINCILTHQLQPKLIKVFKTLMS